MDERQQSILSKRFFLGKTQTEIAKELGISQAQISRLEKNAVRMIRDGWNKRNNSTLTRCELCIALFRLNYKRYSVTIAYIL